jgi:hypothetical protein
MIFQAFYSINNASGAIFHQFPQFSVTNERRHVFRSDLGVFSMKIWKWHCRFKTKKWRNETTLQTLTIREWCFNREFSSKTFRIHQIPGIVFSPRASFSRHPQYTPAPSVSAYRACSKLFAAPSIEREALYPSRTPQYASRSPHCVTHVPLCDQEFR